MSENVTNDENKKTVGFKVSQHEYNVLKQYAASIQKSVEQQFRFVSKIGIYEMQQEIENRVKAMTRVMATRFEQDSGVETKMTPSDIEEYIKTVIKEKEKYIQLKVNHSIRVYPINSGPCGKPWYEWRVRWNPGQI